MRRMWWKHLLFVVFVSSAFAERKSYRGYALLSADLNNEDQVRALNELQEMHETEVDFFTHPSTMHPTDILVPPQLKQKVRKLFKTNGIKFTEKVSDYETVIEEDIKSLVTHAQLSRSTESPRNNIDTNYLTFEVIEEFLEDMANYYSDVMSLESLGLTYEGRDLYMVKISRNDGEKGRPAIIMESLTHAREWITGAVMLNFIAALTEGSSAKAEEMLDMFDWYIVPVHNPDGYVYSTSNDRMWRKNRMRISVNCTGVDLNRNWDYEHGKEGTSRYPCATSYSDKGFSQSETRLFANKMADIKSSNDVYGFISLHSYSEVLLVPMAYSQRRPSDYRRNDTLLRDVAQKAMGALLSVHGKNFTVGTPKETLTYGASGGAYDFALAELGIPFAYTYELRDKGSYGFVLPPNQIKPSFEETFESLYSFAVDIFFHGPLVT